MDILSRSNFFLRVCFVAYLSLLSVEVLAVSRPPSDSDSDGVADVSDSCSNTPSGEAVDTNGCSASQRDSDSDGHNDSVDAFPNDPTEWSDLDRDGIGDNTDPDRDDDGVSNSYEIQVGTNPNDAQSRPSDLDADGIPDSLDDDLDGDGVVNSSDVFPNDSSESSDLDHDGVGDNADTDRDGDGISNEFEVRAGTNPNDANSKPSDLDLDGIPDVFDDDLDGDGVNNSDDIFPGDATESSDLDGDGIGDNADDDRDGDGFSNTVEQQQGTDPNDAGSRPTDMDGDGTPDSLDQDRDGDGILNADDVFPNDASESSDLDNDGIGDNADTDRDGDGVSNSYETQVGTDPNNANSKPADLDADGIPDSLDDDRDGDGVNNSGDAFPDDASETKDLDSDGIGDNSDPDIDGDGVDNAADRFPRDPAENADLDGDGLGDNADADRDGDGVDNTDDVFPSDSTESSDLDGDGIGDNADTDRDGDGISNVLDVFPNDPSESVDLDGDGIGDNADTDRDGDGATNEIEIQVGTDPDDAGSVPEDLDNDGIPDGLDDDIDGDGVNNDSDAFPRDPSETSDLDSDGIGDNVDIDRDGDGVNNDADAFPLDATESSDLDRDGIGDNSDADRDGDGISNVMDLFPNDPSESLDSDGDGVGDNSDVDRDGDGVVNTEDAFPDNPGEQSDYDRDGVGDNSDLDIDGDGVGNAGDTCPLTVIGALVDAIGCSAGQRDTDNDGIADELDQCPGTAAGTNVDRNGCESSIYDNPDLLSQDNYIVGTNQRDFIFASDGEDVLTGLSGNDILLGGKDNDIYKIGQGEGHDLISDYHGVNTIHFIDGITSSDVRTVFKSGNDLILRVVDESNTVRIQNFFTVLNTISKVTFERGGEIDLSQFYLRFSVTPPLGAGIAKKMMLGSNYSENFYGTDDDEVIIGGAGNDILLGDTGDDFLVGGSGDDVYLIGRNHGVDAIFDANGNNEIHFESSVVFSDVSSGLVKSGDDLILRIGSDGDQIIINSFFISSNTISKILFNSGGQITAEQLYGVFNIPSPGQQLQILDVLSHVNDGSIPDDDSDGINDVIDLCPDTPEGLHININGCALIQLDSDGDSVNDAVDLCPATPEGNSVNPEGCAAQEVDTDRDGIPDIRDQCPQTDGGLDTDIEGCANNQKDTDGDGISDDLDFCTETNSGLSVNENGCALYQLDTDGDGIDDSLDMCSNTTLSEGSATNSAGCSYGQLDSDLDGVVNANDPDDDNDGVVDDEDMLPDNPNESLDTDRDGIGNNEDSDDDNDGYSDEFEAEHNTDPLNKDSRPGTLRAAVATSLVPKTNRTTSFYTNDDGDLQKGRDVNLVRDELKQVVYDRANGLVWQDFADSKELQITWDEAKQYCADSTHAGIIDWRLPGGNELFFIGDFSQVEDQDDYTNSVFKYSYTRDTSHSKSYEYWTDELVGTRNRTDYVNTIDFHQRGLYQRTGDSRNNVRCVSGDKTFVTRLTRGSSVSTDLSTQLMWHDLPEISSEQRTLTDALEYCENLNINAVEDWRLPNLFESQTISLRQWDSGVFINKIPLRGAHWWTAHTVNEGSMVRTNQDSLASDSILLRGNSFEAYVRCVRDYHAPVAIVKAPAEIDISQPLLLDGSQSYAYDGEVQSYRWFNVTTRETLGHESEVTVNNTDVTNGINEIILDIEDKHGISTIHRLRIEVTGEVNQAPVANAGADKIVNDGDEVTFDGSGSSDENGYITSYEWTLNGSVVSRELSFTKSDLSVGEHIIQLKVTDDQGGSDTDTIKILVEEAPPVAIAGQDKTVKEGDLIRFDASGSYDSNGSIVSYEWVLDNHLLSKEPVFESDSLKAGDYIIKLIVTDDDGLFDVDEISVAISENPIVTGMTQCSPLVVSDDSMYTPQYPDSDIPWAGSSDNTIENIEYSFNYARLKDPSVYKYLKLPNQLLWDSLSTSEKGLYILNSEREARGLKPFAGVDKSISMVAQQYAEYLFDRNLRISHIADGRTPAQRMDADEYIRGNRDLWSNSTESLASSVNFTEDIDLAVIRAIYSWIYADKDWHKDFDWATGPEFGHRDHMLSSGWNENSGSEFSEGAVGFGVASGQYDPKVNNPIHIGQVIVINTADESNTWDTSRLSTVDTSQAHLCLPVQEIDLSSSVNVNNLLQLAVNPPELILNVGQTQQLTVSGYMNDGATLDLTSEANIEESRASLLSVESGNITAIRPGQVELVIQAGEVRTSLSVLITEALPENLSGWSGIDSEISLYIPGNSSYWTYDPNARSENPVEVPEGGTPYYYNFDPRPFGSYSAKEMSVYTGLVVDENESPLSGVMVRFANEPRLGSVVTDSDGRFIIAGPSGHQSFTYQSSRRLTVQRTVFGSASEWQSIDTVQLLPFDHKQSRISLTSGVAQVHQSSVVTDASGSRKATVVFNGITEARVRSRDGSERVLDEFLFSATEYSTPASMPGSLPVESAFTYCTELHVAGVRYDDTVVFDGNVTLMVDNFLGFDVGEIVPIGTYNTISTQWDASENGVIAMVVDSDNDGTIDGLDYTGDEIPDDLDGNGDTTSEAVGLQGYSHGDTVMWGQTNHFSAADMNYAQEGDEPAEEINSEEGDEDPKDDETECPGSYVMPYQQSFHEDIEVAGTNLTLHYNSQRTKDYKHKVTLAVSGDEYPERVQRMVAKLEIAGHVFEQEFIPQENLDAIFIWDGKDITGKYVPGTVRGKLSIGYEYQTNYLSNGNAADDGLTLDDYPVAWATIGDKATQVEGRQAFIAWTEKGVELKNSFASQLAEGWSLSNVHEYDGVKTVYRGDGSAEDLINLSNILTTGASISYYDGDDGYYQAKEIEENYRIIQVPYYVDRANNLTKQQNVLHDLNTDLLWNLNEQAPYVTSSSAAENYCASLNDDYDLEHPWRLPIFKEIGYAIRKSSGEEHFVYGQNIDKWAQREYGDNPQLAVCVSGTPLNERFAQSLSRDEAAGIVNDQQTGLMWQDTNENITLTVNWEGAIDYCEANTHGGYEDWRLPNINELIYAFPNDVFAHQTSFSDDYRPEEYWINADFRQPYWSSTTSRLRNSRAWAVESSGFNSGSYVKEDSYYVRCVRDSQTAFRSPYVFDSEGKHIKTVDLDSGKTLLTYQYNENSQLIKIIDQHGNTIEIERDNGRPTAIIAPDGQRTDLQISAVNNLERISYEDGVFYEFEYRGSLLTDKVDPRGHRYTHDFDADGRVTQATNPEDGQWDFYNNYLSQNQQEYGYSTAEGQTYKTLRSVLDDGSVRRLTTYKDGSMLDRILSADQLSETLSTCGVATDITNVIDDKTQDEIPSRIVTTQPSGLVNTLVIDKQYGSEGADFSRYTVTMTENGDASTIAVDAEAGTRVVTSAENRVSTYYSDSDTRQLTRVTRSGLSDVEYQYDNRGRIIEEKIANRVTAYTYDPVGRGQVTAITAPDGKVTRFEYDVRDRLSKTIYPDGHSVINRYDHNGNSTALVVPTDETHAFTSNKVNKVASHSTPLNQTTRYEYDRDRRLLATVLPSGQRIENTYNNGQLINTQTPESTITYGYQCGNKLASINEGGETLIYEYDGDLLTSIEYQGELDATIGYQYNSDFDVSQLNYAGESTSVNYDKDGLLTAIHDYQIHRNVSHGLPETITDNTLTQQRMFNGYAEAEQLNQTVDGKATLNHRFIYNTVEQITQKTEVIKTGVGEQTHIYDYEYDDKYRLDKVSRNGIVIENYGYDANGNRTTTTSTLRNVSNIIANYNIADQLISFGNKAYEYDANGRLSKVTRTTDDNAQIVTTYQYDSQGRLLKVITPNKTVEYQHNALGNRVAKLIDGEVTEKYLWQNKTTLLAIYDKDDNLKQRFEYTLGHVPTSFTQNNQRYYILTDQIGSPKLIADENGNTVKHLDYDSFGNLITDSNPDFAIPFGFAGGLQDNDTGLIRFGYRDYDPETGRWTARDPIGFAGGDTNLYGYVLGDPVGFIDPNGQTPLAVAGAIVGGVIGGATSFYNTVSGYTDSGQSINWTNVAAQSAIGAIFGSINGAVLPGSKLGDLADAGGAITSSVVGTLLDGGSLNDAILAGSISLVSNVSGSTIGESIQKRIGQGIDAPAAILHEVASGLTAAQKIIIAQVLAAVAGTSIEEAKRLIEEALNGC